MSVHKNDFLFFFVFTNIHRLFFKSYIEHRMHGYSFFFFSPKHWATHVCSACLVSTDDKKEDGSSDFPFGEMKLDECLSLPEMEGSYLKFLGECPNAGVSSTSTMVLLLCILLPLVVVVRRNIFIPSLRDVLF